MVAFLVALLISVALQVVAYVLTPKPKTARPEAAKEQEGPTSEAGRPVCVPFGLIVIKSPNCLHFSDKSQNTYQVKA